MLQFGFGFYLLLTVQANGELGGEFNAACNEGASALRFCANLSFLLLVVEVSRTIDKDVEEVVCPADLDCPSDS